MKKTPLIIAALLAALAGSVHAQATASTDPIVQMREQQRAANATFSQKREALRAERDAQVAAAADAAGKEATAKGRGTRSWPGVMPPRRPVVRPRPTSTPR
jgi:hypothetical protein